jgi:hypothetical protein
MELKVTATWPKFLTPSIIICASKTKDTRVDSLVMWLSSFFFLLALVRPVFV